MGRGPAHGGDSVVACGVAPRCDTPSSDCWSQPCPSWRMQQRWLQWLGGGKEGCRGALHAHPPNVSLTSLINGEDFILQLGRMQAGERQGLLDPLWERRHLGRAQGGQRALAGGALQPKTGQGWGDTDELEIPGIR